MVEVRCETDFVARNQHFVGLVTALAERLSNFSSGAARDARDRGSCIHKRWIVDEGKLVELAGSSITEAISKLGENIRFVRGCIVHIQGEEDQKTSASASNQVRLLPYTHAVAGKVGNMRQLAEYLSGKKVDSLRYDKVGTGKTEIAKVLSAALGRRLLAAGLGVAVATATPSADRNAQNVDREGPGRPATSAAAACARAGPPRSVLQAAKAP